ncbi:hypothetical protein Aduo_001179 [Ancylostoma duodenale]
MCTSYFIVQMLMGLESSTNPQYQYRLQPFKENLTFTAAKIVKEFGNEVSSRQGLICVREFTMSEIEYFMGSSAKKRCPFLSRAMLWACSQMDGRPTQRITIV